MDEKKINQFNKLIDNLINLRTTYYSIVVVLTGGIIGLFYNLSVLNIILMLIGLGADSFFVLNIINLHKKINKLIKFIGD